MIKPGAVLAAFLLIAGILQPQSAHAAAPGKLWQPLGGRAQIPLWPRNPAAGTPEADGPEGANLDPFKTEGRYEAMVFNVTQPTMTIYRPETRKSGAAILVLPGGGYRKLAIDLEGSEVCDWATALGMTCVVVKYRVPQTWWHDDCKCQIEPNPFLPLQDAQRAIRLLRQRAVSLGIDPHKIGVIGFSAGGHLAAAMSNATGGSYAPVDTADRLSARPDFAMPLYPGHLWADHDAALLPFDHVVAGCPPTFLVQAEDDPVDNVRNSIAYFLALQAMKIPVEMHIYAHGGHAFALRNTGQPISGWPALAAKWLHTIGVL